MADVILEKILQKIPPQNIEAEQSVLGCLMLDKNAIIKVTDILQPGDFYRQVHNSIFETMVELYEKGEPIDLLSMTNRLEEKKLLEDFKGPD
jgi:replicative DNA helicase